MRDQQQRAAVVREPALEPHHGVEVEMVGRLVEQQQVRAADQRAREVEAHAPAAREIRDRAVEVGRRRSRARPETRRAGARTVTVDAFEPGMAGLRARARRALRPPLPVARSTPRNSSSPSSTNSIAGCRQRRGVLRDGGDTPVARHVAIARLAVQLAAQQREQARLAAAVGADDAHVPARVYLQRGVLDQATRAASQGELSKLDQDG